MTFTLEFQVLMTLALALFGGLFMSRIVKPLGLPAVTGYLIAGILLGPFVLDVLGVVHDGETERSLASIANLVQSVALGFIAFAIGSEFKLSSLKQTGRQAMTVGIAQAFITMLVVDGILFGLHFILGEEKLPLTVCIMLGAIATATAPAATLMVVKQYKAKGPVTNILLPVVALDDAVGLICFAVSLGVAQAIKTGEPNMISMLLNPLLEVVLSLLLGSLMGVIFSFVEDLFKSNSKRLCISITFVLLTIAISQLHYTFDNGIKIGFSNLLVCMMMGTIFCNVCDSADELMERTDKWTMPLFILFFVISGADLDFSIFASGIVVLIGAVYIVARCIGKYFGAWSSAKVSKCDPKIVKYLGITLFPQAGVAIGMAIQIADPSVLGSDGAVVKSIVLLAVLVYELVGPLLTKIALTKAGDITPKPDAAPKQHHTVAEVFADDPDDDQ